MSYNEKSRKTCLEKYGNACSLHCGGEREKEIFNKAQRGNRERVEIAKIKFFEKLDKNHLELISELEDGKKLYGQKVLLRCKICGKEKHWAICAKAPSCAVCNGYQGRSKGEDEIINYITSFYKGEIILNSRNIIPPFELDIFLPKEKIAIEYNGAYFHYKNRQDDYLKYTICKDNGIKLIQIYDVVFNNKKSRIFNAIKACILYGGCVFLDDDGIHNNMFPVFEKVKIKYEVPPKKIKLSELNIKVPPSHSEIEVQYLGGTLLEDVKWSEYLYPHIFC